MTQDIRNMINKVKKLDRIINEERERFTTVYHGTDINSAKQIEAYGLDMKYSHGGYFGWGFYTTPDFDLAKSNYAEFNDAEAGAAVLEFQIDPTANILDLRDEDDWDAWLPYADNISDKNLWRTLVRVGIDGLWDNSFGGVIIYNLKKVHLIKVHYL
jgi:hypothetical protein